MDFLGFSLPAHPHAGPAALRGGCWRALRPLLRTSVPLMVALGFTLSRAPPRESPRGQPCGGGAPNRRCGSGKKRWQDEAVHPATAFFADFPLCYRLERVQAAQQEAHHVFRRIFGRDVT